MWWRANAIVSISLRTAGDHNTYSRHSWTPVFLAHLLWIRLALIGVDARQQWLYICVHERVYVTGEVLVCDRRQFSNWDILINNITIFLNLKKNKYFFQSWCHDDEIQLSWTPWLLLIHGQMDRWEKWAYIKYIITNNIYLIQATHNITCRFWNKIK